MNKLTERQLDILRFIEEENGVGNREIGAYLEKKLGKLSRVTVVRDIDKLLKNSLIVKEGKGRSVKYKEAVENKFLRYVDIEEYFQRGTDEREIAFERFNFNVFGIFKNIFNSEEMKELERLNVDYQKRIKKLPPAILKKELERLTIELSWKSSQIEGNTYSLLDTEILIKQHEEAAGHKKEEALMILNHKKAIDYVLDKKNDFRKITLRKIENVHRLIIEGLGVSQGLRKKPVGVVGTRYRPLDNEFQIKEAIEKAARLINSLKNPFSKSLAAILLVSYIQPFEDGNKRASRLLGDAILFAYNICPLSFRSVKEADYKKAIIVFYEQNNIRSFKELFVEQFKFAVGNYFL